MEVPVQYASAVQLPHKTGQAAGNGFPCLPSRLIIVVCPVEEIVLEGPGMVNLPRHEITCRRQAESTQGPDGERFKGGYAALDDAQGGAPFPVSR